MSGKKHSQAFVDIVNRSRARVTELDVHESKARLDQDAGTVFIDVREDREFAVDSCRGAIHIGKGVIERDIEKYVSRKDEPIILYCGGGYRSALAADALQSMGYTNVISMDGGIRAWRASDYPLDVRTT